MAEYLASIFGTEKDKVNCSFYFKIGACRHGDRCSRLHNKPTFSQVPPPTFRLFSQELGHAPVRTDHTPGLSLTARYPLFWF